MPVHQLRLPVPLRDDFEAMRASQSARRSAEASEGIDTVLAQTDDCAVALDASAATMNIAVSATIPMSYFI